jgi:hypothetical protein
LSVAGHVAHGQVLQRNEGVVVRQLVCGLDAEVLSPPPLASSHFAEGFAGLVAVRRAFACAGKFSLQPQSASLLTRCGEYPVEEVSGAGRHSHHDTAIHAHSGAGPPMHVGGGAAVVDQK